MKPWNNNIPWDNNDTVTIVTATGVVKKSEIVRAIKNILGGKPALKQGDLSIDEKMPITELGVYRARIEKNGKEVLGFAIWIVKEA